MLWIPQPHPPERRGRSGQGVRGVLCRVKAGENPGYPRFKVRNRFAGFGFKEYGNGFKVDGRRLKLSGIGRIAVRWHRGIEGTIKTARVFCRAGKWFVAFSCEVEKPEPLPKTGASIGVDLGLLRLATLSNGEKKENPRWYRKILQGARRVLQRKIARCMPGGRNRRRLVLRLRRLMVHVADARKDFLNKFVHELIARFDRIVLEDLRVAAMAHGRFAMSILDAGWSYLVSRLTHKAETPVARWSRSIQPTRPRLARVAVPSSSIFRCRIELGPMRLWRVPRSRPQRRDRRLPKGAECRAYASQ